MSEKQVVRLKNQPGWQNSAMFYQIYPMGFCGAPFENDGKPQSRILKMLDWVEHLKKLNTGAVYFSPVFESDTHGYDTRDYKKIDARLGSNQDFASVCNALHEAGIRVVLDGVFNHVGRGFWAFQDVLRNRESSPYKDWFHINFGGNSNYNDGLWYEGWEGHFELVKLNLQNPAVVDHILECVAGWMDQFAIDGLRLDVAYLLDENFLRRLHQFCKGRDPGFFLLGEMIHGDYRRIMNPEMLDSVTNYECYKGLYSSFNDQNMFEIAHSLNRQFGSENWCLYRGEHLLCFADNHDVSRIHTILRDKNHLPGLYAMLYCMPGIPCLYYGSEWGADGDKKDGDPSLRPCFEQPVENELTQFIGRLSEIKLHSKALSEGGYKNETLLNKQIVIRRECQEETVLVGVNTDGSGFNINVNYHGPAVDLYTGQETSLNGCMELPPYGVKLYRLGPARPEDKPTGADFVTEAVAAPALEELVEQPAPVRGPDPIPTPPAEEARPAPAPERESVQESASIPELEPAAKREPQTEARPAPSGKLPEYRAIAEGDREDVIAFLRERWYSTVMVVHGAEVDMARARGCGAFRDGKLIGLATYAVYGDLCEILSLDCLEPELGMGTRLVERVKAAAKERGCRKLAVTTTNDNLSAMGFYQKKGFDMVRVYHNSIELARQVKPEIPDFGENGIAIRHELEFEMEI